MSSTRLLRAFAILCLFGLAGCPSATTLEGDGGPGNDAAGSDAAGSDAGGGDDAFVGTDAGPAPSWDTCTLTSECGFASMGCCSPCGVPSLDQLDAINLSMSAAHFMEVCPVPTPCPACVTGNNPNLVATCEGARCTGHDVSMMALSACTADTDCVIRYANCCSCSGDPSQVISVRADAEVAVEQLYCDGGGCALDCVPQRDPNFAAACDPTTGHCVANRITIGP